MTFSTSREKSDLLLCTDGLWNYANDTTQIDALVKEDADAITVARRLVEFAIHSGGHDNISVVVLSWKGNQT